MGLNGIKKIQCSEVIPNKSHSRLGTRGFSYIEVLVVVGVIGMILAAFYPSIMNTLEKRGLENAAREILTSMQRAKFQAVKTKLNHRVGFLNDQGSWYYFIEREDQPGTWNTIPGFVRKKIPTKFNTTVSLPDITGIPNKGVVFSPLGFVTNFDTNQNSLSLQSDKLRGYNQPDLRIVAVYAGGSIQYIKTGS